MAKLPLVFSIVVLLCATGLGIAAKGKADRKTRELATAQTEVKRSEATLAITKTDLAKANDSLSTAGKEVEAKAAEVAQLAGEAKAAKQELAASAETVKKRDEALAVAETKLTEANVKLAAEEAVKTTLQAQLADAQKETAEIKVAYEQIRLRQNKIVDDNAEPARKPVASSGPSPNLSGTVMAVNQGLNFLVLSVGDQQGVSVNTSMLVIRGGQRIATLKVTAIEPRASIAEVVPGTLARGQMVQQGDRVVLLRGGKAAAGLPSSLPPKASGPLRGGAVEEPALPEA